LRKPGRPGRRSRPGSARTASSLLIDAIVTNMASRPWRRRAAPAFGTTVDGQRRGTAHGASGRSFLPAFLSPRGSLPEGTPWVGAGLAVLGLTAYGFLILSARAVGPRRYASLSALWAAVYLAGPGFFLPLEQEVGRAVAARRAH